MGRLVKSIRKLLGMAATVAVAGVLVLSVVAKGDSGGSSEARVAPVLGSVSSLDSDQGVGDGQVTLGPPSDEADLDAETALQIAWTNGGVFGDPTESSAQLATLERSPFADEPTLVWAIEFQGACIPNLNESVVSESECLDDRWMVLVDASNGSWVGSFTP